MIPVEKTKKLSDILYVQLYNLTLIYGIELVVAFQFVNMHSHPLKQ